MQFIFVNVEAMKQETFRTPTKCEKCDEEYENTVTHSPWRCWTYTINDVSNVQIHPSVIQWSHLKQSPLQKHLGQSLWGIQSPPGQVEYASAAETLSLFLHAGSVAYVSAEMVMHNYLWLFTTTWCYTKHLELTPAHRNIVKALYYSKLLKESLGMQSCYSPLHLPILPDPSLSPASAACKEVWLFPMQLSGTVTSQILKIWHKSVKNMQLQHCTLS